MSRLSRVNIRKPVLVALLHIALVGCAGNGGPPLPAKSSAADPQIVTLLYDHYNNWRGVRYREGGLSKNGVDCSGYVHLAYKQKLKRSIPRSTEQLAKSGSKVSPRLMQPGDLVFFKTGWKTNHVGIYLKNGKFMHASSSRGVMISRLDNPYWSDAFWMARRY